MSGLNEIIQWTEDNIDLKPNKSSETNFNIINKRFDKDNRSDLSDILGDDKGKYLEWIEQQIGQSRADIEISESRGLLAQVSNFLRGLFK